MKIYSADERRRALAMLGIGIPVLSVSHAIGADPETIRRWAKFPNGRGPSGLRPRPKVLRDTKLRVPKIRLDSETKARIVALSKEIMGWDGEEVNENSKIVCKKYSLSEIAEQVGVSKSLVKDTIQEDEEANRR